MVSQNNNTLAFSEDIVQHAKGLSDAGSDWINSQRENALSTWKDMALPSRKDEEWRYINISDITQNKFSFAKQTNEFAPNVLLPYCDDDEIKLVFVNGIYSPSFSTQHEIEDIKIASLRDVDTKTIAFMQKFPAAHNNYFSALNNILSDEGLFIRISPNVSVEKYIHIVHVNDSSAANTIMSPRTIIALEPSSNASVLESHISFNDDLPYLANTAMDILLAENASLNYYKFQRESQKAYHVGQTRILQEMNSNLENLTVTLSGKITRNNLAVTLNGSGISSMINGLYALNEDISVDNHTSVEHIFPHCTSRQLYKGLLADKSHGIFNGKVAVRSEAQQTNSYQLNKNLLLGEHCRIDTKPQLEIDADDVKCSHGATIGQLNEEEIFYLQTRGIAKREATAMLARGFVGEMFQYVKNPMILKKLNYLIEPLLKKIV